MSPSCAADINTFFSSARRKVRTDIEPFISARLLDYVDTGAWASGVSVVETVGISYAVHLDNRAPPQPGAAPQIDLQHMLLPLVFLGAFMILGTAQLLCNVYGTWRKRQARHISSLVRHVV